MTDPHPGNHPISGSYDPADVLFLLKPVQVADTSVEHKEHLIQSGLRHYSEMITREQPPSERYLTLFHTALAANSRRLASDLLLLAEYLDRSRSGPLTLVSLARAGTPIGAILKRWLLRSNSRSPQDVEHYSISLIRDRGLDLNAVRWILERHGPESLAFIDGWTGKGVMARELKSAIGALDPRISRSIDDRIMVIADLCGAAGFAATYDDYLIPSSLLGATISGLVSRSIRNADVTGSADFDGCLEYPEFCSIDLSRWFVDLMEQQMATVAHSGQVQINRQTDVNSKAVGSSQGEPAREILSRRAETIRRFMTQFSISSENYIKPGIGEATRVLLRRVPWRVILRDPNAPEVQHLVELAHEKQVKVEASPNLPWQAVSVIRTGTASTLT